MPGVGFLAPVLQISINSDLIDIFQVLYSLILTVYKGDFQLMTLGPWCPLAFFENSRVLFLFFPV